MGWDENQDTGTEYKYYCEACLKRQSCIKTMHLSVKVTLMVWFQNGYSIVTILPKRDQLMPKWQLHWLQFDLFVVSHVVYQCGYTNIHFAEL